MEEQIQTQKNETTGLSIKDLFYKYIRFLPLFIISVALSLLVVYMYLRYATLIYNATGTMIIQDEKNSNSGSNDKLDRLFESDNKKNIQNEIEYLRSSQMMSRVVKALNLNYTYLAKGNIKELNIYKQGPFLIETFNIFDSSAAFALKLNFVNDNNFRVNGEDKIFTFGQVFKNQYGVFRLNKNRGIPGKDYSYTINWQPTGSVAGALSGIAIAPKPGTGILVLSLESTNPNFAADVINQLMKEYQVATIDDKNAVTQNRLNFIDKEIDIIERQIDSITNENVQLVKKFGLYDAQTQSGNYLAQIELAKEESKQQRIGLNNAYLIEGYIRNKRGDIPVPSTLGIPDPTLNESISAYNQAQVERQVLLKTAPPGNAAVKQKDEVINRLQKNILESIGNIKESYNAAIGSIQGIGNSAQSQLKLMPEKQEALMSITRQLETKLAVFNSLLESREQSAIALASTISNIKVLTEARANTIPVKPNRRNAQLLAIFIGVLLPALFIFILELLNDKVTTRNDIERITDATILGEIGHSFGKNNLVVTNNNRGVVAEQFRIIRSNLQYVLNHVQKPVILVTSSFSGEGKSFVSTNIGAVMAVAGKKTIILEFDIRKPKVLSHLGITKKPGLTNYLLGKINVENLAVPVDGVDNLFVLPCGPVPPNPAEILLDNRLNDLFDYLRANFDIIIMDTAPVGMVSDAMTLSKFADCTLYLVRQGHTYKKQIGLIDEFYRKGKLPKISIILNDIKLRSGYGYYGYGRYGYGHGYGSGYFQDDEPPPGLIGKWFGWLDTKKWKTKKNKTSKVS